MIVLYLMKKELFITSKETTTKQKCNLNYLYKNAKMEIAKLMKLY